MVHGKCRSHVRAGVATTLFRNVETLRVAGKAKIVFLLAQVAFNSPVLWIMTGQAITNRRQCGRVP